MTTTKRDKNDNYNYTRSKLKTVGSRRTLYHLLVEQFAATLQTRQSRNRRHAGQNVSNHFCSNLFLFPSSPEHTRIRTVAAVICKL